MTSEGYGAFDDPYSYPGTTVLRNRLDIRDRETLEAFEVEITTLRAEEPLPAGQFDAKHYRAIHHHLFQDVYEWAGQYRTVRISKGTNTFCYPENISAQMEQLFDTLFRGNIFADLDNDRFVKELSRFLGDLNAIHPFREGNGRAQLSFVGLIGATFRYPFNFEKLDRSRFLAAMIGSHSGQLEPLRAEAQGIADHLAAIARSADRNKITPSCPASSFSIHSSAPPASAHD